MKVTIDGGGNITAHGDSLTGGGVIVFPVNERPGFPTGWTVTGSSPHRVLKDPSHTIVAAEDATGAAPAEHGVPAGGTTDQVLGKLSDDDYDVGFVDAPSGTSVPAGSSYLSLNPTALPGTTDPVAWTVSTAAGADISLDVTHTIITVATAGNYSVLLTLPVPANVSVDIGLFLALSFDSEANPAVNLPSEATPISPWRIEGVWPFAAGDHFTVGWSTGGVASASPGGLDIYRIT